MGVNRKTTAGQDVTAIRRQQIATILIRRPRVSQRQIQDALTKQGMTNPATGKAWSLGTVNNDIQHIREEAAERMRRDSDQWLAEELDKLEKLEQDAWDASDRRTVLACMQRRHKLLGLDAPDRIQQTSTISVDWAALSDEQVAALARGANPKDVLK